MEMIDAVLGVYVVQNVGRAATRVRLATLSDYGADLKRAPHQIAIMTSFGEPIGTAWPQGSLFAGDEVFARMMAYNDAPSAFQALAAIAEYPRDVVAKWFAR